jgi:hypothetical protein
MQIEGFQRNFPPGQAVPERLAKLLEFQNRSREWYSGHFELGPWSYGEAAWFDGDQNAAKQFVVFGHGSDGSLYALWLYPGRTLSNAPIVFLGSEGVHCGVLSDTLDEFLALLAVGAEELGFNASWGDVSTPGEPPPRLAKFRDWLRKSFRITAPPEPMKAISSARSKHPNFNEWLQEWAQAHFGP